jgi:hypothetical protein
MNIDKLTLANELIKEINDIKEILSYDDDTDIIDEINNYNTKYKDISTEIIKVAKNMFQEKLSKLEKEFNEL